jgi:outer membrane receptor protein involved in Fe transport
MGKQKITGRLLVFISLSFFFTSINADAAIIKGKVLDLKSREALIGAVVFNKDNNQVNASASVDGSYIIKNLVPGTYVFVAQFFGYTTIERTITIADANQTVEQDFLMEAQMVNLGAVKIVASNGGSDNYARQEEKNADYVMNVMSAKSIQLLPDITIGDVLQRVSGVVAEKSSTGGGKYATIRGMNKNYNYTTVDGVMIPSPDYGNRYVPMDLFPSDMVERLEVVKSLTPELEADAIGGAMNLVLKDAPDAFIFNVDVATGYDQMFLNKGFESFNSDGVSANSPAQVHGPSYNATASDFPTGTLTYKDAPPAPNIVSGFTIGNRFFNNKFGILASGSYQNVFSGSEGFFMKSQQQPLPSPTFNTPEWDYMSSREYYIQQTRGAAHLKMDYEFNTRHKITLYTVYTEMVQRETRFEDDTDNTLPGSELDPGYRSVVTYQHIFNTTLKGYDSLGSHLFLDWTGAYANAWSNIPDWDDLSLLGTIYTTPTYFSSASRVWMQSADQDFSGYLNLSYSNKIFGQDVMVKIGAMNRDKSRDAYTNEYDFKATAYQPEFTTFANLINTPTSYVLSNPLGTPEDNNSYSVQEDVTAGYIMAKLGLINRIELVGGVRVENTAQAYVDGEPITQVGQHGSKQYMDVLPSLQAKFKITDKQAIRASYFASISRPSFIDIIPYQISTDEYTLIGNPYLNHTTANNYDLRYEFFPTPSEQLLVGVFYKQIYDAVQLGIVPTPGGGPSATDEQPLNVGSDSNPVINYGIELQVSKDFLHFFRVTANYTYTHSSFTSTVQEYVNSGGEGTRIYVNETRPLQGQVDNVANLSLIFKHPKLGTEAEVSVVYTGKAIDYVSEWYGLDLWQMPMTRLDFSFEQKLSKKIKLSLYGKINNILNTPLVIRMFPPNSYDNVPRTGSWWAEQDVSNGYNNSIVVEKALYGQSYLIGLRYRF